MSAFRQALKLELRHLRHDHWDLAGLTLVPGILIFIVAAIFWQGPMRQLATRLRVADRCHLHR